MAVIGIDLGGTKLALAVFTEDGALQARRGAPLAGRTGAEVGALIIAELKALLATPCPGSDPVRAVGIGIPGIYRSAKGTVWAPNIPGWDDYPLNAEVALALGSEAAAMGAAAPLVLVDSDRACCILGEAWCGSARGARDAIFITVGTGIGAGILADGVVLRGARDIAGAIGWMALDREYRSGYAGMGCFEYHAAGPGLVRIAREAGGAAVPPELTTAALFDAYDAGDAVARHVIDEAITYWGMAVANLVSTFDPEVIIFGGGVFGPATRFLGRIRDEAARWAQPISMPDVRVVASALGGDAVLYGAGHLALRELAAAHRSVSLQP
jgi:glucokinase